MRPEIRSALPEEVAACAEIHILARRAMTYLPQDLHSDQETHYWMREIVFATQEVLVAEINGQIAGFLSLEEDLIANLYVRPEAQSVGLGAALLAQAKARRPEGLRLWVFEANAGAIRFYEREGFRTLERTDGQGNEEKVPDRLMGWQPQSTD